MSENDMAKIARLVADPHADETAALRARVAKLEAALRKVRLLVSDDVLRDHGFLRDVGDALQ